MRFNESEIVEEILEHIRQAGGDFTAWCVGTAREKPSERDTGHGTKGRGHAARDTGTNEQITNSARSPGDGFFYREAYTTYAAEEVAERLTQGCGLHRDRESVPQPGKIVFAYRPTHAESARAAA